MGKVTGFMEYERIEEGYKPVPERLKNYKEFVIGLDDAQANKQAAKATSAQARQADSLRAARLRRPSLVTSGS